MRSLLAVVLGAGLTYPAVAVAEATKIAVLPVQLDTSAQGQVPKIIDDYMLTAVQNMSGLEVIGQEDINALLGFDKEKELLGCDDASCIASIGGALGVDKLVVIKIARLDQEWMITSKLINIRATKVEGRTSDFVKGDVKALLQAAPRLVAQLFGGATPAPVEPRPQTSTLFTAAPQGAPTLAPSAPPPVFKPDPKLGSGARTTGTILYMTGAAFSLISIMATFNIGGAASGVCADDEPVCHGAVGNLLIIPGVVLTAIGSNIYLNGKARATTGDPEASGKYYLRWLGWVLGGVSLATPLVLGSIDDGDMAPSNVGLMTLLAGGSAFVFLLSMTSTAAEARTSTGQVIPMASVIWLRDHDRLRPGLGLAFEF